jgi:hypothetical protein
VLFNTFNLNIYYSVQGLESYMFGSVIVKVVVVSCVIGFGFEAMLSAALKKTLGQGFGGAVEELAFLQITSCPQHSLTVRVARSVAGR